MSDEENEKAMKAMRLPKKAARVKNKVSVFHWISQIVKCLEFVWWLRKLLTYIYLFFQAPAPVQITAEQLLREAKERELELIAPPPKSKITDPEELADFQRKKRKEFEDGIRKNRFYPEFICEVLY